MWKRHHPQLQHQHNPTSPLSPSLCTPLPKKKRLSTESCKKGPARVSSSYRLYRKIDGSLDSLYCCLQ
ncbi:hypothetical protein GDO81_013771 [Engystomops pustulosus]|uniref:Uncharacterized protein n=1 Tax=Engystomops pustulosus TaxID=76066 RepID=A0AAV7B5H2_ENGPU|nr:hypothetical protein GDO81_013771 [Engystomops pustulosus]